MMALRSFVFIISQIQHIASITSGAVKLAGIFCSQDIDRYYDFFTFHGEIPANIM